jgi:hypothetical protein
VKSLIRLAIWGGGTWTNPLQQPSCRLVSPANSLDHCPLDSPQATNNTATSRELPLFVPGSSDLWPSPPLCADFSAEVHVRFRRDGF